MPKAAIRFVRPSVCPMSLVQNGAFCGNGYYKHEAQLSPKDRTMRRVS